VACGFILHDYGAMGSDEDVNVVHVVCINAGSGFVEMEGGKGGGGINGTEALERNAGVEVLCANICAECYYSMILHFSGFDSSITMDIANEHHRMSIRFSTTTRPFIYLHNCIQD
jgi:hypothetical protein